ncbi:hypothetical protein TNCV_1861691 [Trichonephila clavipes]|nr:hypothetical protein TNCV_1861691 [Trichonephila clavipes]
MLQVAQLSHKSSCHSDTKYTSCKSHLHNSRPSFPNTCVARPLVKRKIRTADNKCGKSIVHLKKESSKSVFLSEVLGNTKNGWQTWSSKELRSRGGTQRQCNTKHASSNLFTTGLYMKSSILHKSYMR